jgi:hypothetical protein
LQQGRQRETLCRLPGLARQRGILVHATHKTVPLKWMRRV